MIVRHGPDAYRAAVAALRAGLLDGVDRSCPPRQRVDVAAGQLLVMPAESAEFVGVKVVASAPGNRERGLPTIQGTYLLMDSATLTPVWHAPAPTLTAVRTAAVSALALSELGTTGDAGNAAAGEAIVIGTGVQGAAHLEALAAVLGARHLGLIGRDSERTRAVAAAWSDRLGLTVRAAVLGDLATAEVICCCTSSPTPLFAGEVIADGARLAAVGSHTPDAAELPAGLLSRAAVYLESRAALAEAGDVVQAQRADPAVSVAGTLGELVRGEVRARERGPWVFKSVGEAWEDLCVAASMFRGAGA